MGSVYMAGMLLLVAILPVSNTIALRNLLLLVLSLAVAGYVVVTRKRRNHHHGQPGVLGWGDVPVVVKLWLIYLLLFPLIAVQRDVAFNSIWGEWFEIVLAGLVGWGACVMSVSRSGTLMSLAIANSVPALLHLFLCICALRGWLDTAFYLDPTLATAARSLFHVLQGASNNSLTPLTSLTSLTSFTPMTLDQVLAGFRGIEPMHGNIGYSACQAVMLYCACALVWLGRGEFRKLWFPLLGIGLCFASIVIAQSRGALLFGAFAVAAAVVISLSQWLSRRRLDNSTEQNENDPGRLGTQVAGPVKNRRYTRVFAVIGLIVVAMLVQASAHWMRNDVRWRSMFDKIELGLTVSDPTSTLCNGLTPAFEDALRARYAAEGPAYVEQVLMGLRIQDGARIMLLRSGVELVLENPRGLDASRHTFQKLMEAKCGHPPVLAFAHSHNAWIDLALSLGWAGALLFAAAMLALLREGIRMLRRNPLDAWSLSLILVTGFWIFRGFADGVYREHFLQMQWLLIMYLYGRAKLQDENLKNTEPANL